MFTVIPLDACCQFFKSQNSAPLSSVICDDNEMPCKENACRPSYTCMALFNMQRYYACFRALLWLCSPELRDEEGPWPVKLFISILFTEPLCWMAMPVLFPRRDSAHTVAALMRVITMLRKTV